MKLEKRRVTSKDLEVVHEFFFTLTKTYPENTHVEINFLAACSLFYLTTTIEINYDVAIKLRPYGGLIGIDNFLWINI